MNIEDHLPML